MQVHNRVREFRTRRNWTQRQLAEASGVSRQSIISIERGRYMPSLPLALKLSRILGCATDELFELREDD
jgi:putative transcriptional regulator